MRLPRLSLDFASALECDALLDLVFGVELFTASTGPVVGALDVAGANPVALHCLWEHFSDRAIGQSDALRSQARSDLAVTA